MSNRCQVSGAEPKFDRNVSHSHRRTSRQFNPNIQKKRYWVPSLGRHVTLKRIDRDGIDAVIAEMLARGEAI